MTCEGSLEGSPEVPVGAAWVGSRLSVDVDSEILRSEILRESSPKFSEPCWYRRQLWRGFNQHLCPAIVAIAPTADI